MKGEDRDHRHIGSLAGCQIDLAVGLPSTIEADLVIAGFLTSAGANVRDDWLSACDPVLGELLARLRSEKVFEGRHCETLLISRAAPTVRAGTLMMLGLGPLEGVSGSNVRRAMACAVEQAHLLNDRRVAFGSGILIEGAKDRDRATLIAAMLGGLHGALLSKVGGLRRWTFLVGASCLSPLAAEFGIALSRLSAL